MDYGLVPEKSFEIYFTHLTLSEDRLGVFFVKKALMKEIYIFEPESFRVSPKAVKLTITCRIKSLRVTDLAQSQKKCIMEFEREMFLASGWGQRVIPVKSFGYQEGGM